MEEKKSSRKKKVIIGVGIFLLTAAGGIIAYNKNSWFKNFVDSIFKKGESLPDFKTKPSPRKYETYNGKRI